MGLDGFWLQTHTWWLRRWFWVKVYGAGWFLVADTHLVAEVVVLGEGVWGWMVFGCRHIPGG